MRTTPRRLLAALALTPMLAGCFASGEDGSGASGGSGAAGRLRIALAVPPVQALSPYSNDATVLSKLSVAEGLTALDEDGAAAPALARSWTRKNATTWTFELRKATFQDGTDVTAASVVNALDHANAAETKPRVLSDVTLTAEADDADTVTISTKTADPVLPLRLASPALGILSEKAYATDGTVSPVGTGTGPFAITKLTGKTKATSTATTVTGVARPRRPASTSAGSPTAPPAPTPCAAATSTSPNGSPPPRRSSSTRTPATKCPPYAPTA